MTAGRLNPHEDLPDAVTLLLRGDGASLQHGGLLRQLLAGKLGLTVGIYHRIHAVGQGLLGPQDGKHRSVLVQRLMRVMRL